MANNESKELLLLLQDIETQSRQHGTRLTLEEEAKGTWEGVLFNVAGQQVVAPLNEVKEILNVPATISSVPGAKSWVRGVANVRGNLLPIVDLQVFLGGSAVVAGKRSRILVIDCEGLFAGLMVGDVVGMRHFEDQDFSADGVEEGAVSNYIQGGFLVEGTHWPVFSIQNLVEDPEFQVAAA
jgi:twitching motility protein PilI